MKKQLRHARRRVPAHWALQNPDALQALAAEGMGARAGADDTIAARVEADRALAAHISSAVLRGWEAERSQAKMITKTGCATLSSDTGGCATLPANAVEHR